MACFLKQQSLEGCDSNSIPQLELFSESAWDFIFVIFKSGWDQLHSSENTSIHDNIATHFGNIQIRNKAVKNNVYPKISIIKKTLPPIPPRPSKEQIERLKKHQEVHSTKGNYLPLYPMPRPPTLWPASSRSKKRSQLCQIKKSLRYTMRCHAIQMFRQNK